MKERICRIIKTPKSAFGLLVLLQAAILCGILLLRGAFLLFHTTGVFFWKVFYTRGLPLVIIGCLLCAAGIGTILSVHKEHLRRYFVSSHKKNKTLLVLALIGAAAGVLIAVTRLGLEKENAFYGKPTVPLLEWHILLAFTVCLFWFCAEHMIPGGIPGKFKRILPLLIWLCAVIVWTGIPNQNGFFSPPGRAPNFETYPFSDGSFYGHYARSAASGMGLKGDEIPPRPLYIAFLTGLHLLSDNQYDRIIFFQTLVLGLLPVFVFLCGRDLHSTEAGLCAALFVILRETHAILAAPFGHNVSTTKYFFADIPTALVCAAYIWLLIRWQKQTGKGTRWAFAAGCAMGAMALIRTQSLCLILLLPFPLFSARHIPLKRKASQLTLFLAALGLCVLPWLLRSYRITGKFVFDHPMTQTAEMARSYNFEGADLSKLPDENDGEYSDRMTAFIAASLRKNFPKIARFVTVHFLNSEISGFRLFPLRDTLYDPVELLKSSKPFWETLDSSDLHLYNLIFFAAGYLIWALGIAGGHLRSGAAGFIPLAAILIFNFSTALGRYSAGRYLIPTDWIMMLYFAMGLAEWIHILRQLSGGSIVAENTAEKGSPSPVLTGLFILLTAAAIPAADRLIPQSFVPEYPASVEEKLGSVNPKCGAENHFFLNALAVYPRYYAAGEGEPESAKQGYGVDDHGRLIFLTLAPGSFGTIEMALDEPPEYLPDGTPVWISACVDGATSKADTLIVERNGETLRYEATR